MAEAVHLGGVKNFSETKYTMASDSLLVNAKRLKLRDVVRLLIPITCVNQ